MEKKIRIKDVVEKQMAVDVSSEEELKTLNEYAKKIGIEESPVAFSDTKRYYIYTSVRATYRTKSPYWGCITIGFSEIDFGEFAKANTADQPKPAETKEKVIDWEQRRYEIAKDIFSRYLSTPKIAFEALPEEMIGYSVACADKLIECLKGGKQ